MTSTRKPSPTAWIVATLIGVPLLYVASFGPACWWFSVPPSGPRDWGYSAIEYHKVSTVYWPIGWVAKHGPYPVQRCIAWYATLWIDHVILPCNPSATSGLGI